MEEIIQELLESTKSNYIDWVEYKSLFSSDTEKHFKYITDDEKTTFQLRIKIQPDLSTIENRSYLLVENEDLLNDKEFIYASENSNVYDLCKFIFDNKISTTLNIKTQSSVYDSILNSIGTKASRRDKKIDEILNNNNKSKDSFWKRIFM